MRPRGDTRARPAGHIGRLGQRGPLGLAGLAGRLGLLAAAFALAVTACAPAASTPTDATSQELTVYAAASLRDVFDDLAAAWQAARPDVGLRLAFDGSNVLATQIAEGAPVDVFVSADTDWPARLAADGLTAAAPVTLLRNRVAIVTPLSDTSVETAADLARPGVRIVGTGSGVPITRYAEAAIEQIAGALSDELDFGTRVASNVVSREGNVRLALAKVELGEGDAAFVYLTDALNSARVRQVPMPAGVAVGAAYAAVQISARDAAAAFIEWLAGPAATEVFEAAGFEPVRP